MAASNLPLASTVVTSLKSPDISSLGKKYKICGATNDSVVDANLSLMTLD